MIGMRKMGQKIGRKLQFFSMAFVLVPIMFSVFEDSMIRLQSNPGESLDRQTAEGAKSGSNRLAVIRVAGGIFQGMAEFIVDSIGRAEEGGYNCLVIELDTPGGRLDSTQKIVKRMLSARVPIVVYVSPKGAQAASAGTFVTMAGHLACMAPGTRIGAAHPVFLAPSIPGLPGQDEDQEKNQEKKEKSKQQMDIMMEKVTNDTVAFVEGIAKLRGRNQKWAEKAVRESISANSDQAVELGVVDMEAETLDLLLEQIDGSSIKLDEKTQVVLKTKNAKIDRWEMSLRQKLFTFLSDPNIFWLLMLIGIGGIAMEFYHPGTILPGAIGALCLLLAAISSQVLPLNLGGLVLVLLGIGLMIAEVYMTSFGLLGIGGAVLLVMGGILVIDPSTEPYYLDPNLSVEWSVLIPTVAVLALAFLYIGYYVVRSQRRKIETGTAGMLGLVGEARSDIDQDGGRVFVRAEYWKAVSQEPIQVGSEVEVTKVEGLRLHVTKKS